jgi:cyanophycin synthetase
MKIEDIRYISGPNLYSHLPAMVMRIDLQECAGKESYEFAGLNQKLLEFFPGLRNHHCAKGEPGGFVERLDEGTYIGHVIEHVALEMAELVGIGANRGKTTSAAEGVYDVFVECTNEAGMAHLLRTAFALVEALTRGESYNWEPELEEAKRQAGRTGLGQSTKALVEAAQKRGIPFYRLNTGSLIQLGTGRYLKRIQATITERTSCIGVDIACDKELTKQMLDLAAIPVPFGGVAYTEDEAVQEFRGIERAVVVKPLDGNQGKGVSPRLAPIPTSSAFSSATCSMTCPM